AYEGHNATVAQLTQNLSQMLHMPVNDDSGLIGNFDYIVHYSQDSTAANAQYPGIFQALQDQLGLRLEAGKGPVATYVILHAERPHSQQDAQSSAPNPAAQRFEAASVKPSTTTSVMYVRPQPDRLTADATLKLLIQNAYSVQGYQVAGGPDWINSARYQVVATSNGNPGRGAIMAMLQAMLAERFGLAVYRETRDMPVFALQAAKGGPKLPAPRAGVCDDASHPPGPGDWAGGRMAAPGASPAAAAPCGSAAISLGGSAGAELKGGRIGMPELARLLALITGRSVIDRTGYAGAFDLQLDFLPGAVTAAMPPPPPGAGLSGPSLRDALREQLGLELAPARGPVEVIVIDRAQRPSAN
ncbi:MAG: TIGR03435 family protein, partial [Terriglobales bacterium]